jgi:hypothetical protein
MELVGDFKNLHVSVPPRFGDISAFTRVPYSILERQMLVSARKKLCIKLQDLQDQSKERENRMDDHDFNEKLVGAASIAMKVVSATRSQSSTRQVFSIFALNKYGTEFAFYALSCRVPSTYPAMMKLRYFYANIIDPLGLYAAGEVETFFGDVTEYLVKMYCACVPVEFAAIYEINQGNLLKGCGISEDHAGVILGHPDIVQILQGCEKLAELITTTAAAMNPPGDNYVYPGAAHPVADTDITIGRTVVELKFKRKKQYTNDSGFNNPEYTMQAFHYAYKLCAVGFNTDSYIRIMSVDISTGCIDAYIINFDDMPLYDEIMQQYSRI